MSRLIGIDEMPNEMKEVEAHCGDCGATGVYRGYAEAEGTGRVCASCGGSGKRIIKYIPFTGRKKRDNVSVVLTTNGEGSVSYEEFLAGKMPGDTSDT